MKTNQIGNHKTNIYTLNGFIYVKYHSTDVASFNDSTIILNSGGWLSNTTKDRMNQASNQFGLNYRVFQKDYNWYVDYKGDTIPFSDKMVLIR